MKTPVSIHRNRQWIAAAVMALLVAVAGCHDPVGPDDWNDGGSYVQVMDWSFAVEGPATIDVDDFTGNVTWRIGEPGVVRVRATRRASRRSDLDRIDVRTEVVEGGLHITAKNPDHAKNVSVDLEITAPPDAIPRVDVGVGDIDYRGPVHGECHFKTGVGAIRLALPADANITVELSTTVGSIFIGMTVKDATSLGGHYVKGVIGDGGDGSLCAAAAVGSIYLFPRTT